MKKKGRRNWKRKRRWEEEVEEMERKERLCCVVRKNRCAERVRKWKRGAE